MGEAEATERTNKETKHIPSAIVLHTCCWGNAQIPTTVSDGWNLVIRMCDQPAHVIFFNGQASNYFHTNKVPVIYYKTTASIWENRKHFYELRNPGWLDSVRQHFPNPRRGIVCSNLETTLYLYMVTEEVEVTSRRARVKPDPQRRYVAFIPGKAVGRL